MAPLSGIRVVDFTQNLPGPYTTMLLRSMGADVIKVEPPRGDPARVFPKLFEILNAGKDSVVADLRRREERDAVARLVRDADVVVEGFRPGVMARFGLDAASVRGEASRLVYCSISGYGQQGPYRDQPGHDLNFQALTGVCHMLRDARGRPLGGALPFGDLSAAMTAVAAIAAALFERERTGIGQVLDVAIVDTLLSWTYVWSEGLTPTDASLADAAQPTAATLRRAGMILPRALRGLADAAAESLAHGRGRDALQTVSDAVRQTKRVRSLERLRLHALPHYTVYPTADDRHLSIGIVDEDKFWRRACEVLDMPLAAPLPLWGRFLGAGPLRARIATKIRREDLQVWLDRFRAAGVPVAPVLTVEEALDDAQLRTRRRSAGHVRSPWPLVFDRSELGGAPTLGRDSARWLAS